MNNVNLKVKNKFLQIFKENLFDMFIGLTLIYYFVKYKILSTTLSQDLDIQPSMGWSRQEHLPGHRLLSEPLFMGGAYSGSIDNYNLGPTPYNYPVGLGWFINKLLPQYEISPFYITTNVFYFITLTVIISIISIAGKLYGKKGAYTFIFIFIASLIFHKGEHYYTGLPSHLNPGSVQFYSILIMILFLASFKTNSKKYLYLLIFVSGILLQNYIATITFSFIILLYGLYRLKISTKQSKLTYLFTIISLLPWLQIIFRLITGFTEIKDTIKFIIFRNSWEEQTNYSIPLSSLVNQNPFNNILANLFNKNEIPNNLSIYFSIYFISLPVLNYILIKKEIRNDSNKLRILKIVSFLFMIDIILNFYASNEGQQFNHLAGYSYLFTFLILYKFLDKFKGKTSLMVLAFLIVLATFSNTSQVYKRGQENKIIIASVKTELAKQPIKIVQYDFYNRMEAVYTDFVYELLSANIDLCIIEPDTSKITVLSSKNNAIIDDLFRNTHFVKHLFCDENQVKEKDRRSVYLIEDPSMSLPLKLKSAYLIARMSNERTNRCDPEYYRKLEVISQNKNECLYYREGHTLINLSVYLQDSVKISDHFIIQNKIIESSIINGRPNWGGAD